MTDRETADLEVARDDAFGAAVLMGWVDVEQMLRRAVRDAERNHGG